MEGTVERLEEKQNNKKIVFGLWIFLFCIILAGCSGRGKGKEEYRVKLSIHCDTAVTNGLCEEEKWKGILPENGRILEETEVTVREGDTVFDLLCKVRDDYGIQMEYTGTGGKEYIEGIGNLYEFDGGRWSGWMYSVNGEYPNRGCGQYLLQAGDIVRWDYTCDLGMDLGQDMPGAEEWKKSHE